MEGGYRFSTILGRLTRFKYIPFTFGPYAYHRNFNINLTSPEGFAVKRLKHMRNDGLETHDRD